MSILNCHTRLTIVNCTGLSAVFDIQPVDSSMRIQPIGTADINATIATSASTFGDWIGEWFQLLQYGPTYQQLSWTVPHSTKETTRLQLTGCIDIAVTWGDPSVAWKHCSDGKWSIDISKAIDVTMFLKCDVGKYNQCQNTRGMTEISSVHLQPYLEIACDDDIPFSIQEQPIADMFWRPGINIDNIVHPDASA